MITDFLKDFNLVYIIGIFSAIVSALWAYRRFLFEKQIEKFKDANNSLFTSDKQQVLAAIATLGIFKSDSRFEKNTIDVLLSRLYTELDYDITNAIANVLIQYSNRRELEYIADELADINRNFFYQTLPVKQMIQDLNGKLDWVGRMNSNTSTAEDEAMNIHKAHSAEIKLKLQEEYKRLYPKHLYELVWHKQITADTYSRILRKASRKSSITGRRKGVDLTMYQNEFNYASLAKFRTSKCIIERSALSQATFADVEFHNIKTLTGTTFASSSFHKCEFTRGTISASHFLSCNFYFTKFTDIHFKDVFFWDALFYNCEFVNCKGLSPESFFKSFDNGGNSKFPFSAEAINAVQPDAAQKFLNAALTFSTSRKSELQDWFNSATKPAPAS